MNAKMSEDNWVGLVTVVCMVAAAVVSLLVVVLGK